MITYDKHNNTFLDQVLDKADKMTWGNGSEGFINAVDYLSKVLSDLEDLDPHEIYLNGEVFSINETSTYALKVLSDSLYDFCKDCIEEIYNQRCIYENHLEEMGISL